MLDFVSEIVLNFFSFVHKKTLKILFNFFGEIL